MSGEFASSSGQGLRALRFMMVLSSLSPFFALWGVRGVGPIPDLYFLSACGLAVAVPNLILLWRVRTSIRQHDKHPLTPLSWTDRRDHFLIYLFALFLPLFLGTVDTARDLVTAVLAIVFLVFLFWRLELHYINLAFLAFRYQIFAVSVPKTKGKGSTREIMVITKRERPTTDQFFAYRLSDTVYLEDSE